MAATTSTSCSSFWNFRASSSNTSGSSIGGRGPPRSSTSQGGGCRAGDGVAMWLINGVSTAFFASLERCSCIRVSTVEDVEDINELPLIYNDGNCLREDAPPVTRVRTRRYVAAGRPERY